MVSVGPPVNSDSQPVRGYDQDIIQRLFAVLPAGPPGPPGPKGDPGGCCCAGSPTEESTTTQIGAAEAAGIPPDSATSTESVLSISDSSLTTSVTDESTAQIPEVPVAVELMDLVENTTDSTTTSTNGPLTTSTLLYPALIGCNLIIRLKNITWESPPTFETEPTPMGSSCTLSILLDNPTEDNPICQLRYPFR